MNKIKIQNRYTDFGTILNYKQKKFVKDFNNKERQFEMVKCLCEGNDFLLIADIDRYGLKQNTVICKRCGLVLSNPRMTENEYRDFYTEDIYRNIYDPSPDYENFYKAENDIYKLVSRFKNSVLVLEVGAGGGWNLVPFKGAKGYEYSKSLVELGRKHGINIEQGGISDVNGRYDLIILNHVLEHLLNPIEEMKKLSLHLSEDGIIYIAVPDMKNFAADQIQNAHTYYFNKRTLQYYMSKSGLDMIYSEPVEEIHLAAIFKKANSNLSENFLSGNYEEQLNIIKKKLEVRPFVRAKRFLRKTLNTFLVNINNFKT